ncbi:MAG: hypothetical protein IPP71_23425 [Bacteroidetes bacterium]|nr:hypothetical protein [Bacteroidota bacterium]
MKDTKLLWDLLDKIKRNHLDFEHDSDFINLCVRVSKELEYLALNSTLAKQRVENFKKESQTINLTQ